MTLSSGNYFGKLTLAVSLDAIIILFALTPKHFIQDMDTPRTEMDKTRLH